MAQGMIAQTVVVGRIEQRPVLEQQATVLNKFFLCRQPLALLQRLQSVTAKSGAPGLGHLQSQTNVRFGEVNLVHLAVANCQIQISAADP